MKLLLPTPPKSVWLFTLALAGLLANLNAQPSSPASAGQAGQTAAQEPAGKAGKQAPLECTWLPFPDSMKFKVLGLWWFNQNKPNLWRLPEAAFDELPRGVVRGSKSPSGGRILLKCDTSELALKVLPLTKGNLRGFDVYVNGRFLRSAAAENPNVETEVVLFRSLDRKQKEIVIYLPSNQEISIGAVGVDDNTKFAVPEHRFARPQPLVFYGSSVCQGNGSFQPGMTYPAKLCRDLNLDFVNLGFGGSGKAETNVVALVNAIPACGYVFDLGKSYGMQDATAFLRMLQTVRQSHPHAPIFCLTPIISTREVYSPAYADRSVHDRRVMRDAANEFIQSGAKDVYLIEGTDLLGFDEQDALSKDGVHPSEYGYSIIAGKLRPIVKQALGL